MMYTFFKKQKEDYKSKYESAKEWATRNQEAFLEANKARHDLVAAMMEIVAQETKNANATVKRMTKIAKEALDNNKDCWDYLNNSDEEE